MKKLTFCTTVLIIAALVMAVFQRQPMAIDFDGTGTDRIDYGTGVTAVKISGDKTLMAWVYQDAYISVGRVFNIFDPAPLGDISYILGLNYANNGDIFYAEGFPDGAPYAGIWHTTAAHATTGGWHHIAVTYNNTSAANNPIIYVDGVSRAITEAETPTGIPPSGTTGEVSIGGVSDAGSTTAIDGRITDVRIYNRILTAAEIADIYAARTYGDNTNGLVFNPVLYGSAVSAFDGAALTTSNKIIDPYTLAQGTPQGSPVGAGETYLRLK